MQADLIYDLGGDWAALYVNGVLRFQGHEIRDEDWKTVLTEIGALTNSYQEARILDGSGDGAPLNLDEVEITYG